MTMVNLELKHCVAPLLPKLPSFNVECSNRHDFELTRRLVAAEAALTDCS